MNGQNSPGNIPPMQKLTPRSYRTRQDGTATLLAKPVYYFKKSGKDNFIAADEFTAWRIYAGRNQRIGRQAEDWQYVGRTDGKKLVKDAQKAQDILDRGDFDGFKAALRKAELDDYKLAKKDQTPPPNREGMNTSGIDISGMMKL